MKTFQIIGLIAAVFNCAMALNQGNYFAFFGWLAAFCFAFSLFLRGTKCLPS